MRGQTARTSAGMASGRLWRARCWDGEWAPGVRTLNIEAAGPSENGPWTNYFEESFGSDRARTSTVYSGGALESLDAAETPVGWLLVLLLR